MSVKLYVRTSVPRLIFIEWRRLPLSIIPDITLSFIVRTIKLASTAELMFAFLDTYISGYCLARRAIAEKYEMVLHSHHSTKEKKKKKENLDLDSLLETYGTTFFFSALQSQILGVSHASAQGRSDKLLAATQKVYHKSSIHNCAVHDVPESTTNIIIKFSVKILSIFCHNFLIGYLIADISNENAYK